MHSLKDVPGNEDTPGLIIAATLPRDAANDALVLRPGLSLEEFREIERQRFQNRYQRGAPRRLNLRRLFPEAVRDPFLRGCRYPGGKTRPRRAAAASRWRRGGSCGRACDGAIGARAHWDGFTYRP